jgi:uncharacterized membrane protein
LKHLARFARTTLVGALIFLVPIIVLSWLLGKAMDLAHEISGPLAEILPFKSVMGMHTHALLGVVVLVSFCFLAGVFTRTALAQKLFRWLEQSGLSSVPGYEVFKRACQSLLGVEPEMGHAVVLLRFEESCQLGFRVDECENGLVAVYLPGAPDPRSGTVVFVTGDRVMRTDVPPMAAMKCMRRLGAGAKDVFRGISVAPSSANEAAPGRAT